MLQIERTIDNKHYIEEIKQAYTRIIFLVFAILALIYFNFQNDLTLLAFIMIAFAFATFAHLFVLYQWPESFLESRKIFTILIDITATTAYVYCLEPYGVMFAPMYLWIIFGNGVRFGPKYLYIGMAVALSGLLLILLNSTYWQKNPLPLTAFIIAVIILPVFIDKILKRLLLQGKELEALLHLTKYQSMHDSLTNLPNRKYLENTLHTSIEKKIPFALFFVDFDGFKEINDTKGHAMGDCVLQLAAERLQNTVPDNAIVARYGGDEFTIILTGNNKDPIRLAQQIITEVSEPYIIESEKVMLSASIGISYYPDDSDDQFCIMKYADMAMYQVKSRGKNGFLEYREIQSIS